MMENHMLKSKYSNKLILMAGGLVLFILTLFLAPIADDWAYLASPRINAFTLGHFRRLTDCLIGIFLHDHPDWFPHLNRVLIVVSHTICALYLYKLAKEALNVHPTLSLVFSLLFLIGGNTFVTVINYDCFNQTGSLMFGAMGMYRFLKATSRAKKYIVYFLFCALALCVKESGIVYFAIIPLFEIIADIHGERFNPRAAARELLRFYIPGFICALGYYLSPLIQSQQMWVYGNGYEWKDYILGVFIRMISSYSQLDESGTVALFRHGFTPYDIVTMASILLSIPMLTGLLLVIIESQRKKDKRFPVILLLVTESAIVFTPTLLATAYGSIWSNNCIVFFASLVFSYALNTMGKKHILLYLAPFAVASALTVASLFYQDYQTNLRQTAAIDRIESQLASKDIKNYAVYNLNTHQGPDSIYPVRMYNIQQMFDFGVDMCVIFGYDAQCTPIYLCNERFEYKGNPWSASTYLEMSDPELLRCAQAQAQASVETGKYDLALVLLPTDEFYMYQ
jgi:hypothetical protein